MPEPKLEGAEALKIKEVKEYATDRFGRVVEKASAVVRKAITTQTLSDAYIGGDGLLLPDVALSFNVPQNATQRYLWFVATEITDPTVVVWSIFGRVVFYLNGSKVSEFAFGNENGYVGAGPMVYISPPAASDVGGGQQPAAAINVNWAGTYYHFRSLCIASRVTADKIAFEIDGSSNAAGGFLCVAAQVMSEHETE